MSSYLKITGMPSLLYFGFVRFARGLSRFVVYFFKVRDKITMSYVWIHIFFRTRGETGGRRASPGPDPTPAIFVSLLAGSLIFFGYFFPHFPISVIEAKNLASSKKLYCQVTILNSNGQKVGKDVKTPVIKGTNNPAWGTPFQLCVFFHS